jgi:hypothetical protein
MENKFVPKAPDYKGDGVSIWKAEDKNGNLYLKVKVLGHTISCFKYEPKEKIYEKEL